MRYTHFHFWQGEKIVGENTLSKPLTKRSCLKFETTTKTSLKGNLSKNEHELIIFIQDGNSKMLLKLGFFLDLDFKEIIG